MFRAFIISIAVHAVLAISLIGISFYVDIPRISGMQRFNVYHISDITIPLTEDDQRPSEIVPPARGDNRSDSPPIQLPELRNNISDPGHNLTARYAISNPSEQEVFEYDIKMATSVNHWKPSNDISCGIAPVVFAPADDFTVSEIASNVNTILLNENYESCLSREAYDIIINNKDNSDFVIIDVRSREEYERGHLGKAINIDYFSESFRDELDALDKDRTYLIYCKGGKRSFETIQIMNVMNFRKVINLENGFEDWTSQNLPVL
jgi:rhodanese-related sulfurtransferase